MLRSLIRSLPQAALVALFFAYPLAGLFEGRVEDVTIPFGILLGLAGATSVFVVHGSQRNALILATLGMAVFYAVARMLASDHSILEKLQTFGIVLLLFGVLTGWAMSRPIVVKNFGLGLIILGGIATGLLLLSPGEYQAGRLSFDNNNPIWMARVVGYLGLGAIGLYLYDERSLPYAAGMFILSALGIIMTASRGPLLGLLMAALFAAVMFKYSNKGPILFLASIGFVFLGVALVALGLVNAELFALGTREDSANQRTDILLYTIDVIRSAPQGIGVGWFMYQYQPYPHNIFLEMFVEWGWAVGSIFLLLTAFGGWGLMNLNERFNVVKLLFVYEMVNASLSGDITSPRFLYALLLVGNAALIHKLIYEKPGAPEQPDTEIGAGRLISPPRGLFDGGSQGRARDASSPNA